MHLNNGRNFSPLSVPCPVPSPISCPIIQGPPGPQGPPGLQGPPGPAGDSEGCSCENLLIGIPQGSFVGISSSGSTTNVQGILNGVVTPGIIQIHAQGNPNQVTNVCCENIFAIRMLT